MLLRRSKLSGNEAIKHLIGMQAQMPNSPYVGLWTRLDGFGTDELSRLIEDRGAVRIALMRSTIHLVSARDCLALRPVVQPVIDRDLYTGSSWGRGIAGMDTEALVAAHWSRNCRAPTQSSAGCSRSAGQIATPIRWPTASATWWGWSRCRTAAAAAPAGRPPLPRASHGSGAPSIPTPRRMTWS